jgi:sugar lactone lactonase YvrE
MRMVSRIRYGLAIALSLSTAQPLTAATIYWSTGQGGKIQQAAPNGTNLVDIANTPGAARSIALDVDGGYMYWAEAQSATIRRAWLDGSNPETLISEGLTRPSSVAVDPTGGKLYILDSQANSIHRSNLDGSNVELLTTQLIGSSSLALDTTAGKLYWTNVGGGGAIRRSNLDGTNVETVAIGNIGFPSILAVDPVGSQMFWTNFDAQSQAGANINRANLDGTNISVIAPDVAGGLAFDAAAGKLFWSAFPGGAVVSADPDGSDRATQFNVAGSLPIALAIDNSVLGDANFDRLVNDTDLAALQGNFGTGVKRSQGDFTGDHKVDLSDFGVYKNAVTPAGAAAVPEPTTFGLAAMGFLGLLGLAKRRRASR